MEENLKEMIQTDDDTEIYDYSNNTQPIEDIVKTQDDGILMTTRPTVKSETIIKNEDNVTNIDHSISLVPKYSDVMNMEYEPETEQDLINLTKALNARMDYIQIGTYWMMGRHISSYYDRKGNYGKGTLEKISLEVEIGIDTLRKAIKFAKVYNEEQLKTLLNGTFLLKWNHIAQNLRVEPEIFVGVFKETNSSDEFNRNIMDCKKRMKDADTNASAVTGQSEVSDIEEPSSNEIVIEESIDERTAEAYENQSEPGKEDDVEVEDAEENKVVDASDEIMEPNIMLEDSKAELLKRDQQMKEKENVFNEINSEISLLNDLLEDCKSQLIEKDNSDELEVLNEMLEDFKTELLERDKQKEEDDRIFKEMDKELAEKDVIIERFKEGFKQLTIMVENETSHADLLGMIGGIEFDTIYSM